MTSSQRINIICTDANLLRRRGGSAMLSGICLTTKYNKIRCAKSCVATYYKYRGIGADWKVRVCFLREVWKLGGGGGGGGGAGAL